MEEATVVALEGVMSLVAAIVVMGVGYVEISNLYLLKHRGEVVTATVLDESGGRKSRIQVRFVTLAGETVTGETANYKHAEVGETVQVVYDRADPGRMQAADWGFDYWIPGLILGGGAGFFLVYGILGLWSRPD